MRRQKFKTAMARATNPPMEWATQRSAELSDTILSSPEVFVSDATYKLTRDFGKAVNWARKNVPSKASGMMALPCNAAIFADGASSGSLPLIASGTFLCLSNLVLLTMGDRKTKDGDIDPQDEKKPWNYWMNAKKYPIEFAIMLGTGTGLGLQMSAVALNQDPNQDLTGQAIMGAFGALGLALSMFPEKVKGTDSFEGAFKALNQDEIKALINAVETKPLTASALAFWTGAMAMLTYEAQKVGFDLTEVKPERLQAATYSTLSNFFYMFASKRGQSEHTGMTYDLHGGSYLVDEDHSPLAEPANDNF